MVTTPLPSFPITCTTAQTPALKPPLVCFTSWIMTREMSTGAISQRSPNLLLVNRRLSTTSVIPRGDLRRNTKEDPKRHKDDWTLVAGVFFCS